MALTQLSIFLENRKGRLEAVTQILADAGVNILGLSLADTAEFGILRLIVEKTESAREILQKAGISYHVNDVTAVEVNAAPGGLAKILTLLNSMNVNIEYMYTLAQTKENKPVMILRFSEPAAAREQLRRGGCRLLDETDLLA